MANANEDVVKQGYELFSAGDMDGLKKLFTPDFVHHTPGSSQVAGDHEGPDAAIALYGKYFELSGGTLNVDLKSVKSDGDKVAATQQSTAERGGKKFDQQEVLTFTIKDGKMARIDEQPSDQAAFDDFWA
jgi:ketosteroid isomerase-like protein